MSHGNEYEHEHRHEYEYEYEYEPPLFLFASEPEPPDDCEDFALPTETSLTLLCLDYLRDLRRSYSDRELLEAEGLDGEHLSLAVWALARVFARPEKLRFEEAEPRRRGEGEGEGEGAAEESAGNDAWYRSVEGSAEVRPVRESARRQGFRLTRSVVIPSMEEITHEILLIPDGRTVESEEYEYQCQYECQYQYEYDDAHASNAHRFYTLQGLASGAADPSQCATALQTPRGPRSPRSNPAPSPRLAGGPLSLAQLASAALSALDARTRIDAEREMVFRNPLFEQFVRAVGSKGFFSERPKGKSKGAQPAPQSPEEQRRRAAILYREKYRKVVNKFRSKLAAKAEQHQHGYPPNAMHPTHQPYSPFPSPKSKMVDVSATPVRQRRRREERAARVRAGGGEGHSDRENRMQQMQPPMQMQQSYPQAQAHPHTHTQQRPNMQQQSCAQRQPHQQEAGQTNRQHRPSHRAHAQLPQPQQHRPPTPQQQQQQHSMPQPRQLRAPQHKQQTPRTQPPTDRPDSAKSAPGAHFDSDRHLSTFEHAPSDPRALPRSNRSPSPTVQHPSQPPQSASPTVQRPPARSPSPTVQHQSQPPPSASPTLQRPPARSPSPTVQHQSQPPPKPAPKAVTPPRRLPQDARRQNIHIPDMEKEEDQEMLLNQHEAEMLNAEGNGLMQQKEFRAALESYTAALALSPAGPNSHVYYSNRSAAHLSLNNHAESIRDSQRSLQLRPEYAKAHSRLGLAYFVSGRFREAVGAYEVALEYEPENEWNRSHYEKALKKLEKSGKERRTSGSGSSYEKPFDEETVHTDNTSNCDREQERRDDPAVRSSEFLKTREADRRKDSGNAHMSNKDYEKALEQYALAISASPSGPNSHVYYSNRAAAYCYLGRYDDAADDCERSIELNPSYEKAHARLGLSRFFLQDYSGAVRAYEKALELDPTNAASISYLNKAKKRLEQEREEKERKGRDFLEQQEELQRAMQEQILMMQGQYEEGGWS